MTRLSMDITDWRFNVLHQAVGKRWRHWVFVGFDWNAGERVQLQWEQIDGEAMQSRKRGASVRGIPFYEKLSLKELAVIGWETWFPSFES